MLYYAQGTALVARDEMMAKSEAATKFDAAVRAGQTPSPLSFSTGALDPSAMGPLSLASGPSGATVAFQEIGLGKPLTVQIRQVYTGQYPFTSWFSGPRGMLLSSAIKNITAYQASVRALNILKDSVKARTSMTRGSATEIGTPIVFYTPALVDDSITLDLAMIFDQFPKELVDQVGSALLSAAGIPIFADKAGLLLAAGSVVKLAAGLGEMLIDGTPSFNSTDEININWPGAKVVLAGFRLVTQANVDAVDPTFRTKYHVDDNGQLVDDGGQPYTGDIPFVIISLDGTPNDRLKDFAATAVSADLLARYYHLGDGQAQPAGILVEAMRIYNDYNVRKQLDDLDTQIADAPDADTKSRLQSKRSALVKNITLDVFRPK